MFIKGVSSYKEKIPMHFSLLGKKGVFEQVDARTHKKGQVHTAWILHLTPSRSFGMVYYVSTDTVVVTLGASFPIYSFTLLYKEY